MCQEENGDYTYVERIRVPLSHGTLLLMDGATQDDWQVGCTNQMQGRAYRGKMATHKNSSHIDRSAQNQAEIKILF